LQIRLLGGMNLTLDGKTLTRLGTQKARALLAYLVMHPGQMLPREQIATLLWGDSPDERARHSLRQAIHTLRQALADYFLVEPDRLAFNSASDYWLDAEVFASLCAEPTIEHLTQAAALYRGEFLADLVVRDSLAFEEWLFFERDRLERLYLAALSQLSDALAATGDLDRAIEHAQRLVSLNPLQEQAQRQLMRLYHQNGNRAAALQQYQTCQQTLWRELGAEPEPETTALYQHLLESDAVDDRALPMDAKSRYRLGDILGQGSSGIVRTAHDLLLDRPVTLKLLTSVANDPIAARKLLDAASRLARLAHPNIASIYDAGYLGEMPYVALQPAIGAPLSKHPQPPLAILLEIVEQVANALDHAHRHDILHGDVRPANVFVSDDGMVQLVGFTLVPIQVSPDISLKDAAYLPPELAQGQSPDHRSDLYSLGVSLYELTTGQLPFPGQTPLAIISQHIDVAPVPPRSRHPDLPPELEAITLRLLSKRPQDRPDNALSVSHALARIRHQLEGQAIIEQAVTPAGKAPTASLLDRIARGRLIGRERELDELLAHWQRTEERQSHFVLLSGEPGIGKTRLARELIVYARLKGAITLWGRCYEQEVAVPYRPFIDAFKDYMAGQPLETLHRQIDPSAAELVRLVPGLSDRLGPITPNPPLPPHEERLRLFDGVATFLRTLAAERSALLFLDDLHLADEASLLLLQHLVRHIYDVPLLILGAYRETELSRQHPLPRLLVELNQERLVSRLALRRLDQHAVGELIQAMYDVAITPDGVQAIYRETEGNPFFVEEVVKAMVEEDVLQTEKPAMSIQDWIAHRIPQSINDSISRRLDRVSPESTHLLTLAAVIGRRFPLDLLLAVTDLDEEAALDALDEAVAAQLVRPFQPDVGQIFVFQHPLIAQTLRKELNVRRRARLHARVGQAIERIYAEQIHNWLEELAYHFAQAHGQENAARAITYNILAGDRARQVYAHEEAIRYYRVALDLLEEQPQDTRQGQIWESIGDISYLISRFEASLAAYRKAVEFAGSALSQAVLERKTGLIHARRGDYTRALYHLERAQVALLGSESEHGSQERALIWASQADIYFRLGQLARAREACLAGLSKLQDSQHYAQLAFLHRTLGSVALREGKTPEALKHHAQSLALARQAQDIEGTVAALANLSIASRHAGNWEQALSFGQEGLTLAERVGNYRGASFAHFGLGTTLWRKGQLDQAIQHIGQGLQIAIKIQDRNQMAQLHAYLATILFEADPQNLSTAQEHLRQSESLARELGSSGLVALTRLIQAEMFNSQQVWESALQALSDTTDVEASAPWLKADFDRALALAHLGVGAAEQALYHARRALETATAHSYPYEIATAEQVLAQVLARIGQQQAAEAHLTSAIARLKTLGSRLELGRAQECLRHIRSQPGGAARTQTQP